MDAPQLIALVSENLTIQQIAARLETSPTNVRYWLKKHGLRTKRGPHGRLNNRLRLQREAEREQAPRRCPKCGETDLMKFYGRKVTLCGKCHTQYCIDRGKEKRGRILEALGGKCSECGFAKYKSALDAHHLDAEEKDTAFHQWRGWSWERIEKEIKKCVLLCKCCHAAVHGLLRRLHARGRAGLGSLRKTGLDLDVDHRALVVGELGEHLASVVQPPHLREGVLPELVAQANRHRTDGKLAPFEPDGNRSAPLVSPPEPRSPRISGC
jgi:hypothetical protein